MAGIEIASAYVALTTKMPGVKQDIENELGKVDAEGAGGKVGEGLGRGITNKQAAIAGAVGGIFATIANTAATALGNLIGDAVAQSDAGDKFAKTLDFAGLDTSAIDTAISKSQKYADSTVYDLGTVQNTVAQLAANGIENYSDLTEAAGNLNAVAGGNQSTFESVAMMLSQTAGAGKLSTENWNQLADAIPGASGRLQDAMLNAGAYTGNFREAMEKGEITADEFNAAILEIGTEPVAQEAATSVSTMEGAVGNLQSAIVGSLADAFTTIKPFLTDMVNGLADIVGFIQDNIDWIGPLALGIGIVAGAVALWTVAQWLLNAALTANPIGLIIVGIGLLIGAIILLFQNWDTVVAWITDIWGGFIGWITGVIDGFVGWWNDIWSGVASFFQGIWDGIIAAIITVQTAFGDVFNAIADIVKGAFEGVGRVVKGVINTVIDAINGVIGNINGVAGAIGGAIGVSLSIPKIPRLASGGIIQGSSTGTLAMIGEAGRGRDEAVIPLPPDWRENGIGSGGGAQIVVQPAPGQSEEVIGQVAAHQLNFGMRRAG